MRTLSGRLRAAVVGVVALTGASVIGVAQPASAAPNLCTNYQGYFWSTEQDMADSITESCRRTWIVDPGRGRFLTREDLVRGHADFYAGQGFSRQFLWYAPQGVTHIPAGSPQEFTACKNDPNRNGNECLPWNVIKDPKHSVSFDFGGRAVDLTTLNWAGYFIALACGNWSVPAPDRVPAPVPTIAGVKYEDVNRNGVRDGGEGGIGGVAFRLIRTSSWYGDQGTGEVASTQSAPDGSFAFRLDDMGPGTYVVEESAQDGWVSTTATSQAIEVRPGVGAETFRVAFGNRQQRPPIANAGPDQTVDQTSADGAAVALDGSGSSDPDGDALTYTWSGPFGTAIGISRTVTIPVGTSTVTLEVSDGMATSRDTMSVTVHPPIDVTGVDFSGVEGQSFETVVGTFTDPDPDGRADEYTATIDWGDGTPPSPGSIAKGDDGIFTVTGEHVYIDEGVYTPTVTVADTSNAFNADAAPLTADIADAPLYAQGLDLTQPGLLYSGVVATFIDTNPYGPVTDHTATIDWGDGTPPTVGLVTGPTGGPFTVSGEHEYATLGPKTIQIHIVDEGGSTADATTHLLLYGESDGGDFVIGDGNAAVGMAVTYWGAQWATANGLSGGPAPAAFKGFVNDPSADASPTSWSTRPGNSANPPTAVPTYLAVVVSSSVSQTGSTISGDAPQVVIVKTDPGYAGDPGHAGTGTIVAVLR